MATTNPQDQELPVDLFFSGFSSDEELPPLQADFGEDSFQRCAANVAGPSGGLDSWSQFASPASTPAPAKQVGAFPSYDPLVANLTTGAQSQATWNCPQCNSVMSVFAISCPCGFTTCCDGNDGGSSLEFPAQSKVMPSPWTGNSSDSDSSSEASPAPTTTSPVTAVMTTTTAKKRSFRCDKAPSCTSIFSSKAELDAHVASHHCLEATEARERKLRHQLRDVEQNHAVLREYSNLLRKMLASAQVKVSASTNPFNAVGGRPKRLFRCTKSDAAKVKVEHAPPQKMRKRSRPRARVCKVEPKPAVALPTPKPLADNNARDQDHGDLAFPTFSDADLMFMGEGQEWGLPSTKGLDSKQDPFAAGQLQAAPYLAVAAAEASW